MKWSWKLGRFAGIDAYVHASFLLLVGWAAWAAYAGAGTGLAALLGVVFLLGVFGSVLLHEFGHALTARHFGIRTRRIDLLPIGGVAQLEDEPKSAQEELAIALAGPAVNFIIAGSLFTVTGALGLPTFGLLGSLMIANLSLGLFNLLPAFPMDGGRALRAVLATRMSPHEATRIAVNVGQIAAIAMGIIGLFTNWMLMLVAVFVYLAAGAEGRRGTVYGQPRFDPRRWAESRFDEWRSRETVHDSRAWADPRAWTNAPRREYIDAPASAWSKRPPSSSGRWSAAPHTGPARRIVIITSHPHIR